MNAVSVPPLTVTSAAVNVVDASLSMNVIAAVFPLDSDAALLVIEIVGTTASIANAVAASDPAVFRLPATSVNRDAATVTPAKPTKPAAGVNTAVKVEPEPANCAIAPPVTTTSAVAKPATGSLVVNVISAVSPDHTAARLLVIVTRGAIVSIAIAGDRLAAAFDLPPAVNLPAATATVPGAVEPAAGVNVAE